MSTVYVKKGIKGRNTNFAVLYPLAINLLIYIFLFFAFYIAYEITLILKAILIFVIAGILSAALGRKTIYLSINFIGVSRGSNFKITSPFFALVFSYFILNEVPSIWVIPGMIITASGIVYLNNIKPKKNDLIANNVDFTNQNKLNKNNQLKGVFYGMFSAVLFAAAYTLRKAGLLIVPIPIVGATMGGISAFIFYLFYMISNKEIYDFKDLDKQSRKYFFLSGIVTSIAVIAQFYSLNMVDTAVVMTLISTQALFATILSGLMIKEEKNTLAIVIGSFIVFIGVSIIILI